MDDFFDDLTPSEPATPERATPDEEPAGSICFWKL